MCYVNFDSHPLKQIIELIESESQLKKSTFTYKIYRYENGKDIRQEYNIQGCEINYEWFKKLLGNLKEKEEIAFYSKILLENNQVLHIPMIDFKTEDFSKHDYETISKEYNEKNLKNFKEVFQSTKIYSSGNSYHGYSSVLLNEKRWAEFTISLLLVNKHDDKQIIDSRWVAHRLLEDYGSLRLSNNDSNESRCFPNLIKEITFK